MTPLEQEASTTHVIELRNYLLTDGARGQFIRFFEENFLLSQREVGMHVLGQFAIVGADNRFVFIRAFHDMAARLHGLTSFYGGPFWLARRDHANSMLREHHDVHLLRPLGRLAALTGGLTLEDRAAEPPGVLPSETGLVTVDFYRTKPAALPDMLERFERDVKPALVDRGHRVLGHFVAELAPNDYPRLPVIQDPELLVVLSAYRDAGHQAALRNDWGHDGAIGLGAADLRTVCLRPTARSLIRY